MNQGIKGELNFSLFSNIKIQKSESSDHETGPADQEKLTAECEHVTK